MPFLEEIAHETGLSAGELQYIMLMAPSRYKEYDIPKKSGGLRRIAQPAREVKRIQYAVIRLVLSKFPVHSSASAYQKGLSIRDNAVCHAKNSYIAKMDFKDFFNSIKAADFLKFIKSAELSYSNIELVYMANCLFWRPRGSKDLCLSIGSPASPMLSNLLMYDFDQAASRFCVEKKVVYTRYADDITLSSNNMQKLVACKNYLKNKAIAFVIPTLSYNENKEIIITKKYRRTITGLVITNDKKVSLGYQQKRLIRSMVHRFLTGHEQKLELKVLRGILAHANSCEPDFIENLMRYYGKYQIHTIMGKDSNRIL